MRYFGRVIAWFSGFLSLLLAFQALRLGVLDSSADFSFSLLQPASAGSYRILDGPRVAAILSERTHRPDTERLAQHFLRVCRRHRFDPAFVLSLIDVESGFRADAVSPAGAVGLMQLMPGTASWVAQRRGLGRVGESDLRDPFRNVTLGVAYLAFLRDRYPELSPFELLSAYRMGPARVSAIHIAPERASSASRTESTRYFQAIRQRFSALHGGTAQTARASRRTLPHPATLERFERGRGV
jgi:hypothetical protein